LPQAGESLGVDAEEHDSTTVEQGDIVRNGNLQAMSQRAAYRRPGQARSGRGSGAGRAPACGKPRRPFARTSAPAARRREYAGSRCRCCGECGTSDAPQPVNPDPNRTIRAVGPTFIPARGIFG